MTNYAGLASAITYHIAGTMSPLIEDADVFNTLVDELGKLTEAIRICQEIDAKNTASETASI
jgi:hypothetical protein